VGFPIRKSADQSFFAAPHGLSQRSTSFIASQRQGIHRMPLRHLITLIINAHPLDRVAGCPAGIDGKTSLLHKIEPMVRAVKLSPTKRRPRLAPLPTPGDSAPLATVTSRPMPGSISSSRCQITRNRAPKRSGSEKRSHGRADPGWWSQTGSNRRPPACKAGALPAELWPRKPRGMVGLGRFELPTSRLSSARSNQLSYRPREHTARPALPQRKP
jgi:hypothetical protein